MDNTNKHVVKSTLHVVPWFQEWVEKIIQGTSELEARGTAIYTLSVLLAIENDGNVPEKMCDQGFITACFRSMVPNKVTKYGPCDTSSRYLALATKHIPSMSIDDWPLTKSGAVSYTHLTLPTICSV